MTLEEALSMVDGGPHHIGEWAQAATILAAEVRRLQAIAYPPQDGSECAKMSYKEQYEAMLALALENDERIGELQAENERMRAEAGHIIDETGTKRRVLGTLLLTGDGCVIGHKCELWYALPVGAATEIVSMDHQNYIQPYQPAYSTRAAAEAAERGVGRG